MCREGERTVPGGQLDLLLLHQGAFRHASVLGGKPAEDVIRGACLEGLCAGAATRVLLHGAFLLRPPVELCPPEGEGRVSTQHNDIYPNIYPSIQSEFKTQHGKIYPNIYSSIQCELRTHLSDIYPSI